MSLVRIFQASVIYVIGAFVSTVISVTNCSAEDKAVAIKNGEVVELIKIAAIMHCKSNMKSEPTTEILIGPAQLGLSLQKAMIPPEMSPLCKQDVLVPGYILSLTANGITEKVTTTITVRWRYEKFNGIWNAGRNYIVTMTP